VAKFATEPKASGPAVKLYGNEKKQRPDASHTGWMTTDSSYLSSLLSLPNVCACAGVLLAVSTVSPAWVTFKFLNATADRNCSMQMFCRNTIHKEALPLVKVA
jgi:hypothetical protein